ncbi:RNA recognition motif 2-domain-containing protein [Tricladium varicosporioides]|nr:RNA recognition motif 2-domain-containing protein [Hymenoscyphus varicosporioides]
MSPIGYHHSPHSEIGYSPVSAGSSRDLVPFRPGRRQNAVKVHPGSRRHQPNPASGQHNHVDIKKIQEGGDVRTTVMLRNIPNKVDQAMLKSIVDESSFGRYDFMYLRIDFSNNCNVGYAFINFVDPLDIINFVLARSNQKWHRFKSDKVAEVSYATIQGRDCLIQKFRNSSVMLEPPHYRPKLFFTVHDPYGRTGQEDQFPASDNASKLKRSCENAEHVGLFAPSAGQHLRDEQRRRRSQYDRGTSLAEREEYAYEVYNGYEVPQAIYPFRGPCMCFPCSHLRS